MNVAKILAERFDLLDFTVWSSLPCVLKQTTKINKKSSLHKSRTNRIIREVNIAFLVKFSFHANCHYIFVCFPIMGPRLVRIQCTESFKLRIDLIEN